MAGLDFLSLPYRWGMQLDRFLKRPVKLPRPVISIGNIASGGRAKTPLVIEMVQELKARGMTPVVLTRGYGRKRRDPLWMDPNSSAEDFNAEDVGDEALEVFLKTKSYVLVGSNRVQNASLFLKRYPKLLHVVFVLDDGFQHWRLLRDVDLVVYSDFDLSDSLLPVGRLREDAQSLKRATLALKLNQDVFKRSSMKVDPHAYERTLVLTTRVVDESYLNFVRSKVQAFDHVALRDHADGQAMIDAIREHRPEQLILGFKEAVKICMPRELHELHDRGEVEESVADLKFRVLVVDCHLEFKDKNALWLTVFEKLF